MYTTNLRKVSRSVMPPCPGLLDLLELGVGAKVGVGVGERRLII